MFMAMLQDSISCPPSIGLTAGAEVKIGAEHIDQQQEQAMVVSPSSFGRPHPFNKDHSCVYQLVSPSIAPLNRASLEQHGQQMGMLTLIRSKDENILATLN